MPMVNGASIVMGADDPGFEPGRVWGSSGRVDMRARPGQAKQADGVYASKLPNGRETSSCAECRDLLRSFASAKEAKAHGLVCSMYKSEWPSYCMEQAKAVRR
jgi:hypothetical protein